MKSLTWIVALLCLFLVTGCSDSSNNSNGSNSVSEAEQLLRQFGDLEPYFTPAAMQKLLDHEDSGNPVTLVQLMSITDDEAFARYDEQANALWDSIGARERFRSETFAQMIGERLLNRTRVIEFPSIVVLLSALDTPAFTDLMNLLASASDDHEWVLGEADPLPFTPSGSYFDPALQNLGRDDAIALLAGLVGAPAPANTAESSIDSNIETIINMVVSDAPSPFWMVNLIDHYEQASFPDGRDTDLTGAEADQIYGNAILPFLIRYNSLPALVMPVSITLTDGEIDWDQAAIVRYASRDGFLNAFPLNPALSDVIVYKEAGVENTLVYATEVPGTVLPAPESGPLFNFRYCEVLLIYMEEAGSRADVFNSMPLGPCPQEAWEALDADQIAADYDAMAAGLNGIRFWVLDLIATQVPPGPPVLETFGDIPMRLAASVEIAGGANTTEAQPYGVNRVSRDTVFHYVAGRQVYELEDPTGIRYRMQSFTQGQDPNQQLVDLQRLGNRLQLPEGWAFHVILLEENSEITTIDGIAEVITDDLGNTYQRIP